MKKLYIDEADWVRNATTNCELQCPLTRDYCSCCCAWFGIKYNCFLLDGQGRVTNTKDFTGVICKSEVIGELVDSPEVKI